jgi:hypothetical protein
VTDCEGQSIVKAVERGSVRYRRTRQVAICCGLEFVEGDCHGQSVLDSCGVLSWSAEYHVK